MMNRTELEKLWSDTLRSQRPGRERFERISSALIEAFSSGDHSFVQHIQNRLREISKRSGKSFDDKDLDVETARLIVADEMGFESWDQLVIAVDDQADHPHPPILFQYAVAAMGRGDFSALESMVGGPERFDDQVIEWYDNGYFEGKPETLAEIFSSACMLGHVRSAEYLLDKSVDPYAGMKTGLSGFHYAASSGRLEVIKLLISRKVPMEVRNMYGGTVFEQALWSAVNEHTSDHAEIIEALIDAGAVIEPGTLEWWDSQDVPSSETKGRITKALQTAEKK